MTQSAITKHKAKNSSPVLAGNSRNEYMSSRDIAALTNKTHDNVLKAIRQMERAWEKVVGVKFNGNYYTDKYNKKRPEYLLTKRECLYISTKFNDEARAKLIVRWEQLETARLYAATATLTELNRQVTRFTLNDRKMYDYRQVQAALGFSTRSSTSNVRRHYAALLVKHNGRTFIAEEYVRVMMSRAKTRALTQEAQHAKPVLPANFGQMTLNLKGGIA